MSMRLGMDQQLRAEMQLKLSPRMIQSMEILQLPVQQLEERIREELEKNPALEAGASTAEITSTDFEARFGDEPATEAQPAEPGAEISKREQRIANEREEFERIYEEYGDNYIPAHQPSKWAGVELSDKKQDAMLNMADRPAALEEHLLQQLPLQDSTPIVLQFAEHIIANLDERGYLVTSLDALRANFEGNATADDAEEALAVVQDLDPPGVGARDLQECLLLQLDEPDPEMENVELLRSIILHHLDDVKHNRLPAIEKKLGVSLAEIREALAEMKHLTPNPAAAFVPNNKQYVVPDLRLDVSEEGEYIVKVNEENTPTVHISPQYIEALKKNHSDEAAKEYIRRKVQQGRWLIGAIEQRRATLQKVAKEILDFQREFLERGPEHIQPLKMQYIADRVGVNVTTISRAVADKWIETSRGVFPLRGFFSNGTVTAEGKEIAYDTIKRKLQELVGAEDKSSPLSDEDLENQLKALGFPVARRTITKYRQELGIASSRERKQHS